jgi:hypothetical protein
MSFKGCEKVSESTEVNSNTTITHVVVHIVEKVKVTVSYTVVPVKVPPSFC